MSITKNTSSYRVHGWEHGQDSYESPEAASKDYKDWSGGFTPEEDGLKVISNKDQKRRNGMRKEDLDEGMKTPAEWKAEREKAHPGWNDHDTEDFQNRGDNYPKSNVPDSIEHQNHGMVFTFKNTDEKTAAAFAKAHMAKHGLKHGKITTRQDGDYHDDWVQAHVQHPEVKESVEEKKNESTIDLIAAINSGDTISSAQMFNDALMSKVSELIDARRSDVAWNMFAESTNRVYVRDNRERKILWTGDINDVDYDKFNLAAKTVKADISKTGSHRGRTHNVTAMNESIELDEIKSTDNRHGVVDTESGNFIHVGLSKEKAQRKAQELNIAHFGHQKPTGAGTDIQKRYAKVLHLPGRKVGGVYNGDLNLLKNSM